MMPPAGFSPPPGRQPRLLAIDQGNSGQAKWAIFRTEDLIEPGRSTLPRPMQASTTHRSGPVLAPDEAVTRVAVTTVTPARFRKLGGLRDRLAVSWPDVPVRLLASGEVPATLPIISHYTKPEEAGIDRLLNVLAAGELLRAGALGPDDPPVLAVPLPRYAIVVDAGTATTFEVARLSSACAQVEFMGGCILPGRRAMAAALHQETERLPSRAESVEPAVESARSASASGRTSTSHNPIATSTAAGIDAGIRIAYRAAVLGVLGATLNALPGGAAAPPVIIVAGGGSEQLSEQISTVIRLNTARTFHLPHLTLQGLALASFFFDREEANLR